VIITRSLSVSAVSGNRQTGAGRFIESISKRLEHISGRQWLKLVAVLLGFIALTAGFSYLAHILLARLPLGAGGMGLLYLTVFVIFLAANLSVLIPVPITMPIIIAAALQGEPALVGLAAGVGSALGECSGYVMGRLGHRVLIPESFLGCINGRFSNNRLERDVQKHGPLAIGILAAQPILPFDIAGLIAGSLKMKFRGFIIAVMSGRALKYVAIAYMAGILGYIPFFK